MRDQRRPGGCRVRSASIEIMHDVADDVRTLGTLRRRCGPGSGRVLVEPYPGRDMRDLRRDLLHAIGEPPRECTASRWKLCQLALFGGPDWTGCGSAARQLEAFPDFAPPAYSDGPLSGFVLDDLAELVLWAGIREVWVIRAHLLATNEVRNLCSWARDCGLRLRLIVHGRARRHLLAALRGFRLYESSVSPPVRGRRPWWERPSYRRSSSVTMRLPSECVVPGPSTPDRVVALDRRATAEAHRWRQQETHEAFRHLAKGLLAELRDSPAPGFIVPMFPTRLRIPPDELAAAMRRVIQRLPPSTQAR